MYLSLFTVLWIDIRLPQAWSFQRTRCRHVLDQTFYSRPPSTDPRRYLCDHAYLNSITKTKMAAALNGFRKLCVGGLRSQTRLLPRVWNRKYSRIYWRILILLLIVVLRAGVGCKWLSSSAEQKSVATWTLQHETSSGGRNSYTSGWCG